MNEIHQLFQQHNDISKNDIEQLLEHVTGYDRTKIICNPKLQLTPEQLTHFNKLTAQLRAGKPLAYVVGYKYFWDHKFMVNKHTLIPRADTETLIEATLELFPNRQQPLKILDLGTGSGCIVITLLHIFKNATGIAIDISPDALNVAKQNSNDLSNRLTFIHSNWFENLQASQFDLIISNPPYISPQYHLSKSVIDYEPETALFAEDNGLAAYRKIAEEAKNYLSLNGHIILEIGYDQADTVPLLFHDYNFIASRKDLSGIIRCLVFKR